MPEAMAQSEAPTLLVVRREGGVFEDDETVQVNYRIQGNRYPRYPWLQKHRP